MHARRALLYMPGDDRHKIEKALTLDVIVPVPARSSRFLDGARGVDCICMDMEDGVALNRKSEARRTIAAALRELTFSRSEKLARINAAGSGLELFYKEDGGPGTE
jgi:citrate lyase beta subunit